MRCTMSSPHTPVRLRAQNPEIVAAFLEDGVDVRVRLSGFSMKPLLRSGALLRFSARVEPTVGDIVLLTLRGGTRAKLVAHRVLALDDEQVWTKGDSSRVEDPPQPRWRILAAATAIETEAMTIPLRNAPMRALGLLSSALYPHLVSAYRTVWPRKDVVQCSS